MANWPQTWVETFNDSIEQKFKITELKEKFDIQVSQEELLEYTNALFTMKEVQKIKAWISSVSELAKAKLDILNQEFIATEQVRKTQQRLNKRIQNWVEEAKQSGEKAEGALNSWLEMVNETSESISDSDAWKKVKQLWDQTKNAINKWAETVKELGFLGVLENAKKNWGFWWMMAWFLLGILKMFWIGSKVEEMKEKLDFSSPEYKETLSQTQNTVISYLEKTTWEEFDIETKERLKVKLTPNSKWSLISVEEFKILSEKVKSWKKVWIEDFKNTWVIWKLINDPDFKEIAELLSENINKKLFIFFKSKFEKSWVTFNPKNEWKLKGIIKKEFENTTLNMLVERTKENWWEVHFDWLEWIQGVIWIWTLIPNVILEAYKEDIIKAENLAIWIVESWKNTLSVWLKALDWQNIIPDLMWRMNWDDFDEKIWNIAPWKKLLLERAFYAELWLVTSVLWTIWFYGTSSLVSIIEWTNNKIIWKTFSTPPTNRLEKTLNIIWEWKWVWLKEIQWALKDTHRSYEIVKQLEQWGLSNSIKNKLEKELWEISSNFTKSNTGLYTKANLAKVTKNLNPLQTFHFTKSIEQLQQITKTNEQLWIAIVKWTFTKETLKVKQFLESFKVRYINWRAVLNITDWLKWKEFAKAMWSLAPEMIKGLFRIAPILIVWSTIWESSKEQEWEWYETLMMLNGFVWWMQLFKDTEVSYTEEWLKIKNPESFAWWIALVWMETVFLVKETIQYSKWKIINIPAAFWRAAINSLVRLPLDAIKWVWWAWARWYEALKIAKSYLKKAPKKWKIWLWAALLLWAIVSIEYASAEEINSEQLEKDGLLKNWEPNISLLKEKWTNIDNNKKEEIISLYSISMLEKSFVEDKDKFNFKLNDWIFKINIDKSLENKQVLVNNLLEDVSRFLTEINSNIKLDINFN